MWTAKLVFVTVLAVNSVLWSQSRYGRAPAASRGLSRRALGDSYDARVHTSVNGSDQLSTSRIFTVALNGFDSITDLVEDETCRPLSVPVEEQCTYIYEHCDDTRTVLSIPYLSSYFCAKPSVKPVVFTAYILWLVFLFSTLGISASDFFCPNLSTLATLLGLDENVAGVTFLAFGNGSPDVFATFSAMRANSGGLAIGELLGAASFIVSCVVGSMCIIKPFRVNRGPFLRDVGFFTVAVTLLLIVLWDSELTIWESMGLVLLYAIYATVVVVGTWWENRRERKRRYEAMTRDEYRQEAVPIVSYHDEEPYRDELAETAPASSTLQIPTFSRFRSVSTPDPVRPDLQIIQTDLPARPRTRSPSPSEGSSTPHTSVSKMPSFSLVGALEFRRIVSSLQHDAAAPGLSVFDTPVSPYAAGHYHSHTRSRRQSDFLRTPSSEAADPFDVPLSDRSPQGASPAINTEPLALDVQPATIPTIIHVPASPRSEADTESQIQLSAPPRRNRFLVVLGHVLHVLFPTLHHWRGKSPLGKIAAVLAAPAVMALTLTLPVVVTTYEDASAAREKLGGAEGRLVEFEEEGVERALIAEEEVNEEMHELEFNKMLMAAQCLLGPLFCASVLFDGTRHEGWLLLAIGVAGCAIGLVVAVFSDKGKHPSAQLARCIMGFMIAIVWIMAIADEVVQVLQTLGFIFGLSDAIIGLTIFAVGNSLADLVANMSVAVFAPIMGFSACFGGPMLNILLGVGISGTYIIRQTAQPYKLHFSTTLVITGVGLLMFLLATLLYVPANDYRLTRRWGVALIIAYSCLMAMNIVAEVKGW